MLLTALFGIVLLILLGIGQFVLSCFWELFKLGFQTLMVLVLISLVISFVF